MKKHSIFIAVLLMITFSFTAIVFCGCTPTQPTMKQETETHDAIDNRVLFNKKYYSLGYDGYTQNEYYTFFDNGTATYTHIMKKGENTTFHQQINFKWTYSGEGECILMHNGTQMIKGEQDDAFGFSRVMHLSKKVIYWSASGENTYFIAEDFVNEIPDYAKLITNK